MLDTQMPRQAYQKEYAREEVMSPKIVSNEVEKGNPQVGLDGEGKKSAQKKKRGPNLRQAS
jgi:hypothetical protein